MSNALYCHAWGALAAAAGRSSTQSAAQEVLLLPVMYGLAAVGVCTLAVWGFFRLLHVAKLTLANTPGRPNKIGPVHVVVVLLGWVIAQLIAGAALKYFFATESSQFLVLFSMALEAAILGGALAVAAIGFRHGLIHGLGLTMRHWLYDTARAVVGYLAILPVTLLLQFMFQWAAPPGREDHEMLKALRELRGLWRVLAVFVAAVLAPVAEEVLFRGLIQSMLRRYIRLPWIGILVTATLFALAHYPYWHTMPALFALAVALGYNYERCGRLYAPILLHAFFNAVNIVIYMSLPMNR